MSGLLGLGLGLGLALPPTTQFKVLVSEYLFSLSLKELKLCLINQMENCISIFSHFLTMIILPRYKLIRYYEVFSLKV